MWKPYFRICSTDASFVGGSLFVSAMRGGNCAYAGATVTSKPSSIPSACARNWLRSCSARWYVAAGMSAEMSVFRRTPASYSSGVAFRCVHCNATRGECSALLMSAVIVMSGIDTSSTSAPSDRSTPTASSVSCRMRGSRCGASIASLMTATRIPRMSPSSHEEYWGTGNRADIRSFASNPATASSSSAQSATDRAIGPAVSWFQLLAIIPCVLTRPSVGRIPTAPLHDAGRRIEPPVSSASDPAQRPAATAMPEPVLDPPASCSRFHGLRG